MFIKTSGIGLDIDIFPLKVEELLRTWQSALWDLIRNAVVRLHANKENPQKPHASVPWTSQFDDMMLADIHVWNSGGAKHFDAFNV